MQAFRFLVGSLVGIAAAWVASCWVLILGAFIAAGEVDILRDPQWLFVRVAVPVAVTFGAWASRLPRLVTPFHRWWISSICTTLIASGLSGTILWIDAEAAEFKNIVLGIGYALALSPLMLPLGWATVRLIWLAVGPGLSKADYSNDAPIPVDWQRIPRALIGAFFGALGMGVAACLFGIVAKLIGISSPWEIGKIVFIQSTIPVSVVASCWAACSPAFNSGNVRPWRQAIGITLGAILAGSFVGPILNSLLHQRTTVDPERMWRGFFTAMTLFPLLLLIGWVAVSALVWLFPSHSARITR